jgi:hypothetical protein
MEIEDVCGVRVIAREYRSRDLKGVREGFGWTGDC